MKKNVLWALLCCGTALITGCASTPDSSLLPDTNNRPYSAVEAKPQECTLPEATEKRNTQEHFTLEQKVGDLSQKIDDLKTEVAKKETAPARAKFKHIHKHKRKPCNCVKDGSKKDSTKKEEPKKEEPKKAA
ncbi:MAG: hypothetical protein V4525_03535 [Pseudomonadota bacterium]